MIKTVRQAMNALHLEEVGQLSRQTGRLAFVKTKKTTIMKNTILFALLLLVNTSLLAQLPENPEDVSPLLVGETMPDVQVTTLDGQSVNFLELVKAKPTVVIFYRGGWCPYCNRHLAEVGQAEADIIAAGYQILAISPDDAEHLKGTADKNDLKYQLLSDSNGALTKAAGLAFQAPERYGKMLGEHSGGGNSEGFLPVPAVLVLNTKGEILFEYINPNYKVRMSGELLKAVLQHIEK